MPRKPQTPTSARQTIAAHIGAIKSAARTLERPLSDVDVCDCEAGNADGITEAECGCVYLEAARTLEAAGCYVRRAQKAHGHRLHA